MRGLTTLILAAAIVIGSVVCVSASLNPFVIDSPDGVVNTIGPLSYGAMPMPNGGSGSLPFGEGVDPDDAGIIPGPRGDILFGALHNVGPLDEGVMPGPCPDDILLGAHHNVGSLIAIGSVNVGPGPAPFIGGDECCD